MTPEEELELNRLSILAGQIFKPNSPISRNELFSGRVKLLDVIFQEGQHKFSDPLVAERQVSFAWLDGVLTCVGNSDVPDCFF